MGKNIGENISKSFSGNYSEKLLDHAKQYATDVFITASKQEFQKTTESTGDLIGNKIADRVTKFSRNSQQNRSETVTNKHLYHVYLMKEIYLQKRCRKLLIN